MSFSSELIKWYSQNKRDLPWRQTKDPYKIWLSEIILQQTRVNQGLPYYLNFLHEFPNIYKLASAKEDKVLKLWQGLGYYSRARNLHYTAKYIVSHYDGEFPDNYSDLLLLRGVGSYTAAAISSFAFNLPYAVLDGNVIRGNAFNSPTPDKRSGNGATLEINAQDGQITSQVTRTIVIELPEGGAAPAVVTLTVQPNFDTTSGDFGGKTS